MIRPVYVGLAVATMTWALTAGALGDDEVERGKRLAELHCAGCHVVGSEPAAGRTAPPFPKLADRVPLSRAYLDTVLRNPHPNMDRFDLSAAMVSDLVAYLRSFELKEDHAANGKRLVESMCSQCHVVGSEPAKGRIGPPFAQLANKMFLNERYIDFWLRHPNPPMHPFQLPESTVSDIVAYFASLRK